MKLRKAASTTAATPTARGSGRRTCTLLATARFWRPGGRHGARHWQWFANADQMRAAEDAWLKLIGFRPPIAA